METSTYIFIAMGVLALVNRLTPNEMTQGFIDKVCYKLGVIITKSISKIPVAGVVWQEVFEKWIIDLLNNLVSVGVSALKRGLLSDNK